MRDITRKLESRASYIYIKESYHRAYEKDKLSDALHDAFGAQTDTESVSYRNMNKIFTRTLNIEAETAAKDGDFSGTTDVVSTKESVAVMCNVFGEACVKIKKWSGKWDSDPRPQDARIALMTQKASSVFTDTGRCIG